MCGKNAIIYLIQCVYCIWANVQFCRNLSPLEVLSNSRVATRLELTACRGLGGTELNSKLLHFVRCASFVHNGMHNRVKCSVLYNGRWRRDTPRIWRWICWILSDRYPIEVGRRGWREGRDVGIAPSPVAGSPRGQQLRTKAEDRRTAT